MGSAEGSSVPAVVRWTGWAAVFVFVLFLSRGLVVQPDNVSLIAPASGVALVWLASARDRAELVVDIALMAVLTVVVLLLTDGTAVQIVLSVLFPLQPLAAIYLLRRWTPHLWGGGGRRAMGTMVDFGLVLLAMGVGLVAYSLLRTALGELLIPQETLELALGRATRSASALATIGVGGLVFGGWLAEHQDQGRSAFSRPTPADVGQALGVTAVTAAIYEFGFVVHPATPTTFLLTLTVVWVAVRFNPVVTAAACLLSGAVGVWLTIVNKGPIAAVDDPVTRAAIAQVFVVVLMVIGMVIALTRRQFFTTIDSLERSEAELAVRAEELDMVMAHLEDAVAIIEEGGAIVHTNKALRTAFGSRPDQPLDRVRDPDDNPGQAFHPDGRPLEDAENPVYRALAGEHIETEEFYHIDEFGVARWLEVSAFPVPHAVDAPPRAMILIRDTTAATTHRESLVSFAGTVAHDLNNPLSVIDGWAEALQDDLTDSQTPEALAAAPMVQHIRAGVEQMRGFVADLLAHAVARDQTLTCEQISLHNLVKHIAATRDRPDGGGDIVAGGELVDVWADQVLLRQALDNLIGNAFKYIEPGTFPRVVIEAEKLGDNWVKVMVRDNGIGIPADQRRRVFDQFERLTAENYAGTGLGLAIVKRIVERHGGNIAVTDNPDGIGTCFEFTLPTNAETLTAATRPAAPRM
jgi:PAS domain S-box-containing protein